MSSKKFMFVPWDLDRLFDPSTSKNFSEQMIWTVPTHLSEFVFSNSDYQQKHLANLTTLKNEWLDNGSLDDLIDQYHSQIKTSYESDPYLSFVTEFETEATSIKNLIKNWHQQLFDQIKKTSP